MNKTRGVALVLAAFLFLPACRKAEKEKEYHPYDYDLSSYIAIGDILGVSYTPLSTEVTDEEVDILLARALEDVGYYEAFPEERQTLTEGNVKLGDTVILSCSATVDGVNYAGASAENREVTVGNGEVALDGFDEALVGTPLGEKTPLTLFFPSGYSDFSLRGKEILLTVTVESVAKRLTLPDEIPQEWLEKLTDLPLAEYGEALREARLKEKQAVAAQKKLDDCWMAALEQVTLISYPQNEMERYVEEYRAYVTEQGNKLGYKTLEEYEKSLGLTDEAVTEKGMAYARGDVLQEMVIYAVARNEGFDEMSDELFNRYALPYAEELGLDSVELLTDAVGFDAVQKRVFTEVVKQYIADNAKLAL